LATRARETTVTVISGIGPTVETVVISWVKIFGRLVGSGGNAWNFGNQTFIVVDGQIQSRGVTRRLFEASLPVGAIFVKATAAPLTTKLVSFFEVTTAKIKVDFIISSDR
jgi:hypothetical protein